MSFANLYYKRAVATAKACYICSRPTTIVLATINTVDFIYTCPGHLSDQGFASLVRDSPTNVTLTPEEIMKVKEEWEEKQKKKLEKEKQKEKEAKDKTEDTEVKSAPSRSATSTPTHERYVLHRDYFAMRQSEHRKRKQVSQAKELAPRLPGAPRDAVDIRSGA